MRTFSIRRITSYNVCYTKLLRFLRWPPHCVQNTPGAEFHPDLQQDPIAQIFLKGTRNIDDGYSAFEATNLDLATFLREQQVEQLFIVGP